MHTPSGVQCEPPAPRAVHFSKWRAACSIDRYAALIHQRQGAAPTRRPPAVHCFDRNFKTHAKVIE